MRDIATMMRLDWTTTKLHSIWWIVGLADLVLVLLGIFVANTRFLMLGAVAGMASSALMMPFVGSQQHGLEGMLALLPLRRRTVVWGHYGFALSLVAALVVNFAVVDVVTGLIRPAEANLSRTLGVAAGVFFFFVLTTAIEYPILLKWGFERAPFAVYGTLFGLCAVLGLVAYLDPFAQLPVWPTVAMGLVALLVVISGSLMISLHVYETREI